MPHVTYSDLWPVGYHSPHLCKGGADEVSRSIRSEKDGAECQRTEEIYRCGTCGEVTPAQFITWEQVEFIRGAAQMELWRELRTVLAEPGEMVWHRYAYIEALRGAIQRKREATKWQKQNRATSTRN